MSAQKAAPPGEGGARSVRADVSRGPTTTGDHSPIFMIGLPDGVVPGAAAAPRGFHRKKVLLLAVPAIVVTPLLVWLGVVLHPRQGAARSAPGCTPASGRYYCDVWREATTYDSAHRAVGVLYPGRNYFYCQTDLGIAMAAGGATNVWWAETDDDTHNTDVYVSDVLIEGGANDAPVPGLPTCKSTS